MDGYQFTASIVQSLASMAWPAALVTAVWLFRERITALLPLLRLKYKDLDVSFRLDQAEKEAEALKTPEAERAPERTPEETNKFERLVTLSPSAAVIDRSRELEDAVETFAISVGMTRTRMRGLLDWTRELRKHGLIDHATSALLDDLRAVRNAAAHGGDVNISREDALRFGALADKLIQQFRISTAGASAPGQPVQHSSA